jgi:hypothetical protein
MVDNRRFCPDHNHAQPDSLGILCEYPVGDGVCGKVLRRITDAESKKKIRRFPRLADGQTYEDFLAWKASQNSVAKESVKPPTQPHVWVHKISGGLPSLGKHR